MSNPHTIVAGAGLGGLCLAQALRRIGLPVTVLERDPSFDARPHGYRLHLDARAARGLRVSLPPELFALVEATAGAPSTRLTVTTTKLRTLRAIALPSGGPTPAFNTSVDRATLREILSTGLDDIVHYGAEVVGYESDGEQVTALRHDGESVSGELLVGADGVHSAVRRQLLPAAEPQDSGASCLYGRTPLTPEVREQLPAELFDGFMAVVGLRGMGMALGLMAYREPPADAAARVPGAQLSARDGYVMWALSGQRARFKVGSEQLEIATGPQLHAIAQERVGKWDARLRAIVAAADPDSCAVVDVLTAPEIGGWPASNVTLLGDAIHAMSPAGGSGANLALQDAGLLAMTVGRAVQDDEPLRDAVAFYEDRLREHGFAAVRESLQAMRRGPRK